MTNEQRARARQLADNAPDTRWAAAAAELLDELAAKPVQEPARPDQMRAYGEACAAAERDRIRQALLDMQAACTTHNHYAHALVACGLYNGEA